ncbi:MAG: hypothetical protein ACR2P0_04765 [Acidimicrobiales bacterium]
MLKRIIQGLRSIIDHHTAVAVALALFSTWICRRNGWIAEFPLTMVGTAVVFPIVFSIGGAYKRREAALDDYGSIKAHGRALHFATRDWIDDTDSDLQAEVGQLLYELLAACRTLFTAPVSKMGDHEARVDEAFSNLSTFINGLRDRGLPSGEASRCNQFLSKMMISFESVKHVYQYRTPVTLRTYSKVFIYILPVLYGPYFAAIALDYSANLAYVMPVLLSVILVSLDNIQEHLENPFDQVGEDDVIINAEKFVGRLGLPIDDVVASASSN